MFTFTKTATTDLLQAGRPTNDSLEVSVRLALRWHHAYRHRHYVDVTRLLFGSSSYDSVMHTAPEIQLGDLEEPLSSPSRVWGRAPAKSEFGAF